MKYTISPTEKPPLGLLGGSVHDWERGIDPFSRECMPEEFQHLFPDKPAATGWLALDWCGNVIGFAQDGNILEPTSPARTSEQVAAPAASNEQIASAQNAAGPDSCPRCKGVVDYVAQVPRSDSYWECRNCGAQIRTNAAAEGKEQK